MSWRAWFVGGDVYDSASADPTDLPGDGCLYVVAYREEPDRWEIRVKRRVRVW